MVPDTHLIRECDWLFSLFIKGGIGGRYIYINHLPGRRCQTKGFVSVLKVLSIGLQTWWSCTSLKTSATATDALPSIPETCVERAAEHLLVAAVILLLFGWGWPIPFPTFLQNPWFGLWQQMWDQVPTGFGWQAAFYVYGGSEWQRKHCLAFY